MPHIRLSETGRIAERYLKTIPGIDKYVIMPNHIHLIIRIDGPMWASAPTKSIATYIRSFKILVTKEVGRSIFQRSYHDHIIRGDRDYEMIWEYIENNPAKWEEDCFFSL